MGVRNILAVLILAGALGLPFAVHEAQQAQARLAGIQASLRQLQFDQQELGRYQQHLARYQDYTSTLESFASRAQQHGIDETRWDSHSVDIKEMFLPYDQLSGFVADLRSSPGSYFIPERMALRTHPTVTSEDAANGQTARSEPGGLTLSVTGRFMVER